MTSLTALQWVIMFLISIAVGLLSLIMGASDAD